LHENNKESYLNVLITYTSILNWFAAKISYKSDTVTMPTLKLLLMFDSQDGYPTFKWKGGEE
jgi:hypothetical protein